MSEPLLSVTISVDYPGRPRVLSDVAFEIASGEALGLVGESGSGKSTIALAVLRLLDMRGGKASGSVRFDGRELMACREREMRTIRGRDIALVLQSPHAALNPMLRLETHMKEAWCAHSTVPWREALPEVEELLRRMELPADKALLRRYPRQVSVGQAQRVMIAMALLHRPRLLIADEPTSALDPIAQNETLALLASLRRDFGMAMLYISHNLESVASVADQVAVLEAGTIIERGPAETILRSPEHPYTRRLVGAGRT